MRKKIFYLLLFLILFGFSSFSISQEISIDWEKYQEINITSGSGESVSFSPDGRWLAVGSNNGWIYVWDILNKELKWEKKAHSKKITSLQFNPENDILASGSSDGKIKIWDITAGIEKVELGKYKTDLKFLRFSPSGGLLAGAINNKIKLWSINARKEIKSFEGHKKKIIYLTFDRYGKLLISVSEDKKIIWWDIDTGKQRRTITVPDINELKSASGTSDGNLIAVGVKRLYYTGAYSGIHEKEYIQILDSDGKSVKIIGEEYKGIIPLITIGPEGRFLITTGLKKKIRIWDVKEGKQIIKIEDVGKVKMFATGNTNDGLWLSSIGSKNKVKLWKLIVKGKGKAEFTLAVIDLKTKGIEGKIGLNLSDIVRSEIIKTNKYIVLSRDKMETILSEQAWSLSGFCDELSCRVEVGKTLGAEKIVAGSVGKIGDTYIVSLDLIDVTTTNIENSVYDKCKCNDEGELIYLTQKVVGKLLKIIE